MIIRINFEEDDSVGVLERINNRHNEIFAVFFPIYVKGVVSPTRCDICYMSIKYNSYNYNEEEIFKQSMV